MIRKLHFAIRMISYACGLTALLLIMIARTANGPVWLGQLGFWLLLVMFGLFCVSYVLFAIYRQR